MFKKYIPFAHAKSIFEIDNDFYNKLGIKYIFVDLDNTLDSYKTKIPSKRVYELKDRLSKDNIELIITSNNTGKRVKTYSDALKVRYISSIGKPFSIGLNKNIKKFNINKSNIILIGDQTTTDIAAANRTHIKSVLTDKIVKEDQPTTRFNRLFDKPIRKSLKRKNLLRDWREI